jgi:polyphosphate glucokinase
MPHTLGIDIGGSSIKAAPVDTTVGGLIADVYTVNPPRPFTPEATVGAIREIVGHFSWSDDLGCGYPGVVKHGIAFSAANISSDWLGTNIVELLKPVTTGKVAVLNDADAAALAEMKFGAGKDHHHADGGSVLVITLGTGIGTAFFHNGRLFPNTEFGHVYMSSGHEAEDLAAGLIRSRDELSWEEWGGRVNDYLHEMNKLISPDLIVIGGGVSENFDRFREFLTVDCELSPAQMTNDAGIVGAALAVARR